MSLIQSRIPLFLKWNSLFARLFPIFLGLFLASASVLFIFLTLITGKIIYLEYIFMQALFIGAVLILFLPKKDHIKCLSPRNCLFILLFISLILVIFPLVFSWMGWSQNYSYIGGILPWSDAESYYSGAQSLLYSGHLGGVNLRRPVNEILFALRLIIGGDSFQMAMMLQALMLWFALFLSAYSIYNRYGLRAGLVMFTILILFALPYFPTTLSESLGMTFGALSFTILWWSVINRKWATYCLGMFFLGFAFITRPGPLLLIITFSVFAGWHFRLSTRKRITIIIITLIAAMVPFLINYMLSKSLGDGTGTANSNFAYVFYGLVTGGKGWHQAELDFSDALRGLSEVEISRFIYIRSWEYLKVHPIDFLRPILISLINDPINFISYIFNTLALDGLSMIGSKYNKVYVFFKIPLLISFIYILIIGFVQSIRNKNIYSPVSFIGMFWLGLILSLPFFYKDGGIRTTIPIIPFVAATIVIFFSEYFNRNRKHSDSYSQFPINRSIVNFSGIFGSFFVLSSIFLPAILPVYSLPNIDKKEWKCTDSLIPMLVVYKKGLPKIDLDRWDENIKPGRLPIVPTGNEYYSELINVPHHGKMMYIFDYISGKWIFLNDEMGLLRQSQVVQKVCVMKKEIQSPIYYLQSLVFP